MQLGTPSDSARGDSDGERDSTDVHVEVTTEYSPEYSFESTHSRTIDSTGNESVKFIDSPISLGGVEIESV